MRYCVNCGDKLPEGARFCGACGTPVPAPSAAPLVDRPDKVSGLAIASLVLACLGLLSGGLTGILGLVFGAVALSQIGKSQGRLGGKELALAGVTLSALWLAMLPIMLALVLPVLAGAQRKAREVRRQSQASHAQRPLEAPDPQPPAPVRSIERLLRDLPLAGARRNAVEAACMSNLKQLGLAVHMYAADHKDKLPAAAAWRQELKVYLGDTPNTFQCPALATGEQGYAFNAAVSGLALKQLRAPQSTIVLFECRTDAPPSGGPDLAEARHGDQALVVFADGHAAGLTLEELKGKTWKP